MWRLQEKMIKVINRDNFFIYFCILHTLGVYVCLCWGFYSPVNPVGSCWARSVYLTTLLLGRLSPLSGLTSIVHILLPETDNCPSWISGRKRITIENISWSKLHERILPTRCGSNPQPPDHQSDVHPTEPPRPAGSICTHWIYLSKVSSIGRHYGDTILKEN